MSTTTQPTNGPQMYTGITIGPIYKTLLKARKTRELWAASYLFSYLMKQLLIKMKEKKAEILLPYVGKVEVNGQPLDILNGRYEAGVFPDRCVFSLAEPPLPPEQVQKLVDEVVRDLAGKLARHLKQHYDEAQVQTYFAEYFQVYWASLAFEGSTAKKQIVKDLFARLDFLELQAKIPPTEIFDVVYEFLHRASFRSKKSSFLVEDAIEPKLNETKPHLKFHSIIEIAAKELIDDLNEDEEKEFKLKMNDDDKDDQNLIDLLRKIRRDQFLTHHKYIAIVQFDGDNFGKTIARLNEEEYAQFSKALATFSLAASELIKERGGMPVYLGGDDALFFAPVRLGEATIFDLINQLDDAFRVQFAPFMGEADAPSLSFGLAIGYYKHPMMETLAASYDQLNYVAKAFTNEAGVKTKNALAVQVRKHSGAVFAVSLHKSTEPTSVYQQFIGLAKAHIQDQAFLTSVIHHLERDALLYDNIAQLPDRIDAFFANAFNEGPHQNAEVRTFLQLLAEFIQAVYREYPKSDQARPKLVCAAPKPNQEAHEVLNSTLRILKFINQKDDE
jgi:CRISPR-associated protein Cmr2